MMGTREATNKEVEETQGGQLVFLTYSFTVTRLYCYRDGSHPARPASHKPHSRRVYRATPPERTRARAEEGVKLADSYPLITTEWTSWMIRGLLTLVA